MTFSSTFLILEWFPQFFERFLDPDIFGRKTALSLEKLDYNHASNSTVFRTSRQKTEKKKKNPEQNKNKTPLRLPSTRSEAREENAAQ